MRDSEGATGWTGWIAFGGIMLVLLGLFHAVEGLVAVFDKSYYLVAPSGLVVNVSYAAWGWLHFGLGVLAVLTGIGMLTGNRVAQAAGVVIAALSAIVHLAFIAAYPAWSLIIIVVDVIVIYAIMVHGREMKLSE
ncbi:DUF7144 family membrane protein [Amycolatopsis acididurans]|nr:hypothetical protein [Amycolatopsis acididurans]